MDLDLADTGPGAGRYVLPLPHASAVVALAPIPGEPVMALFLFQRGELVEVVDEPEAVASVLAELGQDAVGARWLGGPPPVPHA